MLEISSKDSNSIRAARLIRRQPNRLQGSLNKDADIVNFRTPMAVKTEKDLPEFHRANWLKAMSAMQLKNYGYTIQLLQTILKSSRPVIFSQWSLIWTSSQSIRP